MKLERGQIPERDELYDLYISQNKSVLELCELFKRSRSVVENWLRNYEIKKPKELHQAVIRKNIENKYGVSNISQLETTKEKVRETNKNKFGKDYYTQTEEYRERYKNTCISKYGVDNVFKDENIKKKIREKNKVIFGTEVPFRSEIFKQKVRENNKNKYGVDWVSQVHLSHETLEIIHSKELFVKFLSEHKNKTSKEIADILGVSIPLVLQHAHKYDCFDLIDSYTSSYEVEIREFLKTYGVELNKTLKVIHPNEIDLYSDKHKIGIEFNGDYWHSSAQNSNKLYHQNKSLLCQEKGVRLIHIFEYEWNRNKDKLKSYLLNQFNINTEHLYARDCEIREVSVKDKNLFLDKYHLQGRDASQVRIGMYYNNELVALMTFGKPRFNKNYSWELVRYCSKSGISVIGGASKLLSHFRRIYKGSIISYSDFSKFDGGIYERLGFRFVRLTEPNYVWINLNSRDVLSRYKCQMKNENRIMSERGYVKIYDCGNKVWELTENNK